MRKRIRFDGLRRGFAGLLLLAGLALAGCVTLPAPPEAGLSPAERSAHNLRVFDAAWNLVHRKYYDAAFQSVDWAAAREQYRAEAAAAGDDRALYRTINLLLGQLRDEHTHALSPADHRARRLSARARVGIGLMRIDQRWVINEVLPGSPAAEAGVRPGWIVLSRNGRPWEATLDQDLPDGEPIPWTFLDARDQRIEMMLAARSVSTAPRREARTLEHGIVYLRFDEFDGPSRRWLSSQLRAHRDAPAVIIDLRRNAGGGAFSLSIAIGEFFRRPVACGRFISRSGHPSEGSSWQWGSARYRGHVAILVGNGSASSAEIFTAVLRYHGRAVVFGRKTAGAVLGSHFYTLPDGGRLQISRYDYHTPGGERLEQVGVEPDHPVPLTLASLRTGRDPDLEAARQYLARRLAEGPPSDH